MLNQNEKLSKDRTHSSQSINNLHLNSYLIGYMENQEEVHFLEALVKPK
jgi:hypothetical protein